MMRRKYIWLVWQIGLERIGNSLVQLQDLRVIASSEEKADLCKSIFEKEVKDRDLKKSEFIIEEREINHMLGWQDLHRNICEGRYEKDDEA